jgi:hypothetical protein
MGCERAVHPDFFDLPSPIVIEMSWECLSLKRVCAFCVELASLA